MKRTNKFLLWSAVLALLLGFGMSCGGMEEDEGALSSDEIGEVASNESALLLPSCPNGYYKQTMCNIPNFFCFRCCPTFMTIKLYGKLPCITNPQCAALSCNWSTCQCKSPKPGTSVATCGVYFNYRENRWYWHCCDAYARCTDTPV